KGHGISIVPRADGGPIPGYSPHAKADNILVAATADEYMMQVSSHRKYGTRTMDALNRGLVDPAALERLVAGRYADGGPIRYATSGTAPYVAAPYQPSRVDVDRVPSQTNVQQYFTQLNPDAALIAAGQRLGGL